MKVNSILCLSVIQGVLSCVMQDQENCCNNCVRVVVGLPEAKSIDPNDPIYTHREDCYTFQKITVTPAPSISTTVTTIFVPRESPPSYASAACSNNGDLYASACSCWGITADTITASTPTTIVTVTATYVTTTPSSPYNCINPGKCGSLKYINDSLCGSKGRCTCSYDLRGNPVCVEEVDCASKNTCNTDADCVGGEICWDKDNTCCRDNLCTKLSTVCANTASTRLMFQGGKEVRLPRVRIGEN